MKKMFWQACKKYSTGSLPSYKVTPYAIKSWPWGVGVGFWRWLETLSVEVGNRAQTHVSGESLANKVSG